MTIASIDHLSPREREILTHIAEGRSLVEIARELHRSLKTIETHRLSIGRKLEASDRLELAKIAMAHGLIPTPTLLEGSSENESPSAQATSEPTDWLEAVRKRTDHLAGPSFLNELCAAFCEEAKLTHTGVCVPETDETGNPIFRSLAFSHKGVVEDQFSYPRTATPCDKAIEDRFYMVHEAAQEIYPDDQSLVELNVEAYSGICLEQGEAGDIGVLWVLNDKPFEDPPAIEHGLRALAPRVASTVFEIEQNRKALRVCEDQRRELATLNRSLRRRHHQLDQIATFYIKLSESMSDGLVVLDKNYAIEYANPKFQEIIGMTRDELISCSALDLLTPESREAFLAMQSEREHDQLEHYKACLKRPDGTTRDVLIAPRTLIGEQGEYEGSFGVVTDLHDAEKAGIELDAC